MRDLRQQRCLITGAASGIGRAMAVEFAAQGCRLLLVDVQAEALQQVAKECTAAGAWVQSLVCDLTQPSQITELTTAILSSWSAIDLLINNAGIAFYGPTESMSAAQWDKLLQINLLAPIQLTRELLPAMLQQGRGHILNVCSISGLVAGGRFAAYHVSKYGLIGFTEALRAEYNRRGIGVTALCPGPVQTNLYQAAESGRSDRRVPEPPAWLCASSQTVARRAVRAVRKNQAQVLITPTAHLLSRIKRWCPWLLELANSASKKQLQWSYWFPPARELDPTPVQPIAYAGSSMSKIPAPHAHFQSQPMRTTVNH